LGLNDLQLHLVDSWDEAQAFRRWLGETRRILGLDIETTGLSLKHDDIRLIQFGDAREGWALPMEWGGVARHALAEYDGPVVLQHAKFDASFLMRDGYPFPEWHRVHDTMMMMFLVNSAGPRGLKPGAALYVDPQARSAEAQFKAEMKKNRWDYRTIPLEHPLYWGYGAADTCLTAMLAETLWPAVQPYRQAYDLEMACERVLCGIELRGLAIDLEYVELQRESLRRRIAASSMDLPDDLNPNAPDSVAAFLEAQGVVFKQFTPTGKPSMAKEVLDELAEDYPIVRTVLSVRSDSKLLGSYFDHFAHHAIPAAGYHTIHPQVRQLEAATGRMSVVQPAMQTLPKTAYVRDAVIPRPGRKLVLADYDNEELRLIAHFSQDAAMIEAFAEGQDLHMNTARAAFGDAATRWHRGKAKNGIFSHAYGARTPKLAKTLGVDEATAQRVADGIDRAYPGIPRVMSQVSRLVEERAGTGDYGYVDLPDTRRLRVPKVKAYVGLDYLVQGTGRIVMAQGLVDLDAAGLGEFLDLPVHDEVVLDVPNEDVEDAVRTAKEVMAQAQYTVPLTVSAKVVDRWGDAYREDD
jgi:DNA polymerase-1